MKKGRKAEQRSLQVSPRTLESHHGQFAEPFPLVVTVALQPEVRRECRFDKPEEADKYMAELKAAAAFAGKTIRVRLSQPDTSWEVRVRQSGYNPVNITAGSLADANKLIDKVGSDRAQGLVIDYPKALHVTFAELMVMHIDKHKRPKKFGRDFYKVAAWLAKPVYSTAFH